VTQEQLIGRYLRELRLSRGWTLKELSKKTAVAGSSLSRVELGERGISINVLCKLARAFEVSPGDILKNSGYWDFFEYDGHLI